MDAFFTTLVATLLAETGGRAQLFVAAQSARTAQWWPVVGAAILCTLANSLISATLGEFVGQWVSEEPVRLFYALALVFAGAGMLAPRGTIRLYEDWRIGSFGITAIGLFLLQIGDKSQFIIGATAARTQAPLLTAFGGVAGIVMAHLPAAVLKDELAKAIPLDIIRRGAGAVFLLIGIALALSAWGLVN